MVVVLRSFIILKKAQFIQDDRKGVQVGKGEKREVREELMQGGGQKSFKFRHQRKQQLQHQLRNQNLPAEYITFVTMISPLYFHVHKEIV